MRPVSASTGMRSTPRSPRSTATTGRRAGTVAASASTATGRSPSPATNGTITIAPTSRPTYSQRVRMSPRRTASVRLPEAVSPGMSRRLLTTSRAVTRNPTGMLAPSASHDSRSSCT